MACPLPARTPQQLRVLPAPEEDHLRVVQPLSRGMASQLLPGDGPWVAERNVVGAQPLLQRHQPVESGDDTDQGRVRQRVRGAPQRTVVPRYVAVASIAATPGEDVARALFREHVRSDGHVLADAVGYRPPPPGAVAEALLKGAADKPICRVEPAALADAIDVVNAYAGTAHTAADLAELHDAEAAASIKSWGRAPGAVPRTRTPSRSRPSPTSPPSGPQPAATTVRCCGVSIETPQHLTVATARGPACTVRRGSRSTPRGRVGPGRLEHLACCGAALSPDSRAISRTRTFSLPQWSASIRSRQAVHTGRDVGVTHAPAQKGVLEVHHHRATGEGVGRWTRITEPALIWIPRIVTTVPSGRARS